MKLSLRTLMLCVALVAVVTAALAQPSLFWMRMMFTVTVSFLAFAAVGAIAARGKTRTFWIGAVAFGCAYAYVLLGEQTTGFQARSTMLQRALITQPLLDALAQARGLEVRSHFGDFNLWDPAIYTGNPFGPGGMGGPGMPSMMGSGMSSPPSAGGGFFDVDADGLQDPTSGGSSPQPGSSGFGENSDGGGSGSAGSMGPPGMSSSSGGPGMGMGGSPGPWPSPTGPGSSTSPAGAPPMPAVSFTYASYNHFLITGHCAFVILFGLIGGVLSRWAFGRDEER